jgi:hypothetical protein
VTPRAPGGEGAGPQGRAAPRPLADAGGRAELAALLLAALALRPSSSASGRCSRDRRRPGHVPRRERDAADHSRAVHGPVRAAGRAPGGALGHAAGGRGVPGGDRRGRPARAPPRPAPSCSSCGRCPSGSAWACAARCCPSP